MAPQTGLENRRSGNGTVGSNPTLSAENLEFLSAEASAHGAPFTPRSTQDDGTEVGSPAARADSALQGVGIDKAVRRAIEQDRVWQLEARPSSTPQPRVTVVDGEVAVTRRPFKHRGEWCVRWAGIARLTEPHVRNGFIAFKADWS